MIKLEIMELRHIWWIEELLSMPFIQTDFVEALLETLDGSSIRMPPLVALRIMIRRLQLPEDKLTSVDTAELLGRIKYMLEQDDELGLDLAPSQILLLEVCVIGDFIPPARSAMLMGCCCRRLAHKPWSAVPRLRLSATNRPSASNSMISFRAQIF